MGDSVKKIAPFALAAAGGLLAPTVLPLFGTSVMGASAAGFTAGKMATGGMGDVLTGIIVALVAQGYASEHAACLGAWLAGRAADHAIESGVATHETLRPTTVILHLAGAFRKING